MLKTVSGFSSLKVSGTLELNKLSANGSLGTSGLVLHSNGSSAYWDLSTASIDTADQYSWSNTQTFSNTITFSQTIDGTANNSLNLGGVAAASYVNTSGAYTISGIHTYSANLIIGSTSEIIINSAAGIVANNSFGTAGQRLTTNGSAVYWSNAVSSVATGNGMTGGPITTTGTVSVLANTGIVANATGVFVNSAYIATISANNASYLGGVIASSYLTASGAQTLLDKRISPRIVTQASVASLSVDIGAAEIYVITAQAGALTIAASTLRTPTNGEKMTIRIKDNGTLRAITWGTGTGGWRAVGTALPTSTTAGKTIYIGAIYNSNDARWDVVSTAQEV